MSLLSGMWRGSDEGRGDEAQSPGYGVKCPVSPGSFYTIVSRFFYFI